MLANSLIVVGVDHSTAGIDLRERLAFADDEIVPALWQLTDPRDPLLEQAAVVSTCNRIEVYGAAASRPSASQLAGFLARYHGLDAGALDGAVYVYRDEEAAHHLAATAAGMRSLVLGEAQIQGQVRTALKQALWAGTAGPELRRLFESAIAAGRRVRSRTCLGRGVASVPHASIELVRRRLGTLSGARALLIGVGSAAELTAKSLTKHGVGELLVLGRDGARAERFAQRYGGRTRNSRQLVEAVAQSDVVVSSTGAPHPIVHCDQVERAVARRRPAAPLLLIDLAVPRDIDPTVGGLSGAELYTIDDLRPIVKQALIERQAELPAASAVLRTEVQRFTDWLSRREAHGRKEAAMAGCGAVGV